MEYELLGWPDEGPTLRLDHERFSYAGKFVMSNTGKAVVRESHLADESSTYDEDVLAAVAFNEDRTDGAAWLRYVTVRCDRRGEKIGARLAAFTSERLLDRGYDEVRIAVNNVFAYEALHKAGFGYTGRETGLAELVLVRPADPDRESYQSGLNAFRARDGLSDAERAFIEKRVDSGPPAPSAVDRGH